MLLCAPKTLTKSTLTLTLTLHLLFFPPVQTIYYSMPLKSLLSSPLQPARWGVTRKMERKRDSARTIIGTETSCQSSVAMPCTFEDENKGKPCTVQTGTLYSHLARSCQFTWACQPPKLTPLRSSKLVLHGPTTDQISTQMMTNDLGPNSLSD